MWPWGARPSTRADMAIELVCSCGRVVRCDQPSVVGQTRCPACGAVVSPEANRPAAVQSVESPASAARKPLWALMGKAPAATPGTPSAETGTRSETKESERQLAAMGPSPGADKSAGATAAERPATGLPPCETASPPARKGLWGVMQTTPLVPAPPPAQSEIQNPKSEVASPAGTASASDPQPAPDAALADVIGIPPVEAESLTQRHAAAVRPGQSQKGLVAASLGGLSVLLSFLSLIDAFWSTIPATLVGFAAIVLGMQAASDIQHSAGRQTG